MEVQMVIICLFSENETYNSSSGIIETQLMIYLNPFEINLILVLQLLRFFRIIYSNFFFIKLDSLWNTLEWIWNCDATSWAAG